jgi:hypothetical protein
VNHQLRKTYDQCASRLRQSIIQRDYCRVHKVLEESRQKLYHDLFKQLVTDEVKRLSEIDRAWWERHFSLIVIDNKLDYV